MKNTPTKTQRARPIVAERTRAIGADGFAFLPNRFLHDGFFAALHQDELMLYILLVLAGDRRGMSYYHYDSLCQVLRWPVERYLTARNSLIAKDLIAFDGSQFQVLELPAHVPASKALCTTEDLEQHDTATVRMLIAKSLGHEPGDENDADR